jgi:hypothetical protein
VVLGDIESEILAFVVFSLLSAAAMLAPGRISISQGRPKANGHKLTVVLQHLTEKRVERAVVIVATQRSFLSRRRKARRRHATVLTAAVGPVLRFVTLVLSGV